MRKKVYGRDDLSAIGKLSDQNFEDNYRYEEGVVVSATPGGDVNVQISGGQSAISAKNKNGYVVRAGDHVLIYRAVRTNLWNLVSMLSSVNGGSPTLGQEPSGTILDSVTVEDLPETDPSTATLEPGNGTNHKILALHLRRGATGAGVTSVAATARLPNQSPTAGLSSVPDALHQRLDLGLPRAPTLATGSITTRTPAQSPTASISLDGNGDGLVNLGIPRAVAFGIGTVSTVVPSASPTASLSTDSNGDKTLNLGLVRARALAIGTVTTGAAGSSAAASLSADSNGDQTLALTIPTGANGAPSAYAFDDVAPGIGITKTYTHPIDAQGTYVPFNLTTGDIITLLSCKGFWKVTTDSGGTLSVSPGTGNTGVGVSGKSFDAGRIILNTFGGSSDSTDRDAFSAYTAVNATEKILFTANSYSDTLRRGQLLASYSVQRAGSTSIVGTTDFRTGAHGWAPVAYADRWSNDYSGRYLSSGVSTTQGFYEDVSVFDGWASCIQSPTVSPISISSIEMFYDLENGNGALGEVWGHYSGSWHFISGAPVFPPTSGSHLFTFGALTVDAIACTMTGYSRTSTTWRFYKVIVS